VRASTKFLTFIVNFLLGVAWAIALVGATYGFMTGFSAGFFYALLFTFLGSLPGLFLVVLLEFFYLKLDTHLEMKKQTEILNEILKGIKK